MGQFRPETDWIIVTFEMFSIGCFAQNVAIKTDNYVL